MLKLLTQNFWYDVILKSTYFKSLENKGIFNRDELGEIKNEFKKFTTQNKSMLMDVYSEFHLSWCSAILATYRACLKKKMPAEKASEFTEHAVFDYMQADRIGKRIQKMLDNAGDPFRAIVNSSKYQEEKFFGKTFGITRPVDDDNHYLCLIHKCFYNDFFRRNKAPALMQIACKWDFISWAKGIVPEKHHIKFTRTVTLGLDDQKCPFEFERIRK